MKSKLVKLFSYYFLFQFLFLVISNLSDKPIFNLITLENLLVSDASLNDLYYPLRDKQETDVNLLSGKIVLINTGSLQRESFRKELSEVLDKVQEFEPSVIGIDHQFDFTSSNLSGSQELIRAINQYNNIIIAGPNNKEGSLNNFVKSSVTVSVSLPLGQSTIRRYYSDTSTFAYKLAQKISNNSIKKLDRESFVIHYLTSNTGYYTLKNPEYEFYKLLPDSKQSKYLLLEASDILNNDSATVEALRILSPGKALIIGHMGNTALSVLENDIEDKHPVPCDTNFVNRGKSMAGMLIHANAFENILEPKNRFTCLTDSFLANFIKQLFILLFMYYLLFTNFGKAFNIFSIFIISVFAIFIVIYLMTKGIYLEMGLTLLQLLIIEEIIEVFDSIHHLIANKIRK